MYKEYMDKAKGGRLEAEKWGWARWGGGALWSENGDNCT